MDAITQTQSIIYFILTGITVTILTILSPIHGSSSIMVDLGLVAIYGNTDSFILFSFSYSIH